MEAGRAKGVLIMQGPSYLTDVLGMGAEEYWDRSQDAVQEMDKTLILRCHFAFPISSQFTIDLGGKAYQSKTVLHPLGLPPPVERKRKGGSKWERLPVREFRNFFLSGMFAEDNIAHIR